MDIVALQDRIARGMSVAARKLGSVCIVYRPRSINRPIDDGNQIIKLFAAFKPGGSVGFGSAHFQPLWRGVFDASHTRPGDYIVGVDGVYFVAMQQSAGLVQCVLTNRKITIVRPSLSSQGGYSGLYASDGQAVIVGWPVALFEDGSNPRSVKAGTSSLGGWTALLPLLPAAPQLADVMTDDAGGTYIITAAEQSSIGWRLLARQINA